MKIDPRFTQDTGVQVFTGNELLVKGCLEVEGGVHLMTGYPGSPIAGFFDALEAASPLLDAHGQIARIANNEALSAAMVNGAQMAGCRAVAAMKSVGMHVASDAIALGVLAGTKPESGGLIIVGDDPWSDSTQVPADSRFLAEHCRLPVLEPSTPQELKDWVNIAFKIGEAGRIYIGYLVTVTLADGGGSVECRPNQFPAVNEHQKRTLSYRRDIEPNLEQTVLLPPRTHRREAEFADRFAAVITAARKLGVNRISYGPQKGETVPMGFVASGVAHAYLTHALSELGLLGRIPILRLGMSYPVDDQLVGEFARQCDQLIVIEERRSFVERQVADVVRTMRSHGEKAGEVFGKAFPRGLKGIPETRGLNPSLLMERLIPLVRQHPTLPIELTNGRLTETLKGLEATALVDVQLPSRTPTFCPGCPHRDSSSVLLELRQDLLDAEYMLKHHKRKPVDLVAHGDTGCYTMLMFEPNKALMHNYSGMGLGGGTGSGADPFIDNKQIVFMGDGTFFHSGQSAISQSIYTGQDICYIILDNKITAMTGHQVNPGDHVDLMGRPAFAQDIERIVAAMIPKEIRRDVRVVRIDPSDRDRYRNLLEETILSDGVKVVVADKECGITFHRRARKVERDEIKATGFVAKKTFMNVAEEVCEYCLECTNQTGCPGLTIRDTDYGQKVQTDLSWCVNDGACNKIHACPSFEQVTVTRKQAPRMADEHVDLSALPEPPRPVHAEQQTWRCHLAGVGGMGIGVSAAILVTAGHKMGYQVQFLDKKGLAIRNGGVYSQLVYTRQQDKTGDGAAPASGSGSRSTNASAAAPTGDARASQIAAGQMAMHTADRNSAAVAAGRDAPDSSANPNTSSSSAPEPTRIRSTQASGVFTNDHGAAGSRTRTATTTPVIPYGRADLVLGIDLLEAARGLDPGQPYRVSSRDRTAVVVNTARTPTILNLMGEESMDPHYFENALRDNAQEGRYFGFNVGDVSERLFDSKLYANVMMLGVAYQLGYLPLTLEALETAIRTVVRHDTERNLRAFRVGRRIAIRPDLFVVEPRHEYETAAKALRRKCNTLVTWFGPRRGRRMSRQFRFIVHRTRRAMSEIADDNQLLRDMVIRIYDCLLWGGRDYARQYADQLVAVYRKDDASRGFAVLHAVAWNLAKVMLIKDEIYVSTLLTNPEKYQRDRRRFGVNPAVGDRIAYRHHNRPEFIVFGKRIRFDWTSRDWQLRLMSKMGFTRKLFPKWHIRERNFRDWYQELVERYESTEDPRAYERWLAVLKTPESVAGYREVRYPTMTAARQRADQLLHTDLELFEPDLTGVQTRGHHDVSLTVLSS